MLFKFSAFNSKRPKSGLIVVPYMEQKEKPKIAASESLGKISFSPIECGDFSAKSEEVIVGYSKDFQENRYALVGLGDSKKLTVDGLRRAYAALVKICVKKKIERITLVLPKISGFDEQEIARGVSEGVALTNYHFIKNFSKKEEKLLKEVTVVGASKTAQKVMKESATVAESVYFSRDLINDNADTVTPQYLVSQARSLGKKYSKLTTTIFDKKRIEKEKMGLILAVNRGSARDPALIMMKYRGNPNSKEHTVVVGKGITYDTGGLNLKPTGSMETMRGDMGGSAAVFGIMDAVSALGLKVNVTGIVPTTENCIDATSYKPGDVYVGYSGKSVEIGNTDAEGRLVLADALAYATKNLKPTRIIDFATLTGAMVVALGSVTTGLFSNDDKLSNALTTAGESSYERVWRLPLFDEYRKQLKSDIADISNTGTRGAGSITAAHFLKEFVGDTPWAHLDIAGTSFLKSEDGYLPKNGTGVGVRLIVDFLSSL